LSLLCKIEVFESASPDALPSLIYALQEKARSQVSSH
jgi:hypothetical protein